MDVIPSRQPLLETTRTAALYLALGAIAAAVFAVDLVTPLGVAVWILYVLPVGLTLLGKDATAPILGAIGCTLLMVVTSVTDAPGLDRTVAYINRGCGVIVLWSIGFLARRLIATRTRVEQEDWLRTVQSQLLQAMQGELPTADIAARALRVLAPAMDAAVIVLYVFDGNLLRFVAAEGVRAGADVPESFHPGEGLTGEAIRTGKVAVLTDLPETFLPIRSALVSGTPRHVLVSPLLADLVMQGVVEAGFVHAPSPRALALLDQTRDTIAVALRAAFYRDRLRELLEETQRQSRTLQAQQEELRVANEELEQQADILKSSQVRLEQQQAELEASNATLESQATNLERQQEALSHAKQEAERASRYKSEFLANMSHELRTPLNSTLILAKLLAENKAGRLAADEVRYAETIYAAGNSLLALINDILDLSKIEAGAAEVTAEPTDVSALVQALKTTFQPIASDKQLAFSVEVSPQAPATVTTDAKRLQQILTNLLSNACKFTPQGSVMLRITPRGPDQVIFEVSDTGVGIPPDQQDVIFEAFRQADGSTHRMFGGTGLGLSISRELAHLLGGDLRVSSTPGRGSVFTLTIPVRLPSTEVTGAPADSPKASTLARHPSRLLSSPVTPAPRRRPETGVTLLPDDRDHRQHQGRLILVVEDDTGFARILLDLAHELEFDCVVATTTDEGMALARDLAPSGILLDVNLPDGSGLALLDRLKHNPDTRHIPVHMVSVADSAHTALALGAVGFAQKPVTREELVKVITNLEQRLEQRVRRILVVEDDARLRGSMRDLLQQLDGVTIHDVGTARDALAQLEAQSFDCVVLDLNLPDSSGYEILETMSGNERYSFPPVIIYTGGPLTAADEARLRRYSRSVIVKGARSPERLLDEVTLFLHQVESRLPPDSRRMLETARQRDDFFDGKTILVVEDDVRNVFALTSVFEPRGAKVAIARNGREGVEMARAMRPDLVLMDIMMPEMDGLAATRELRADPELRDLPVIALTAKAMRDDYAQCIAAGANDYLAKPLDVDTLVSLARVWMSR